MGEPSDISRTVLSLAEAGRVIDALNSAEEPGTPAADPAWPRIDGYILERELGRGASGVTYLAHKAGSESAAAIKIIRPHGPNGVAPERAWRELDLLQQARSPSVPRLLDFGRTGHSLYLVTEYIEGTPLDRLFDGQEPAEGEGLRARMQMLTRIGRAVQDLHERGVIHRDLKPSNIIVGPRGDPFIIDMGIAQLDTPDPHETLTLDGQTVGTPAFMAPEQARGLRETISTRSDVYGLGAVGYWLCTGQTPHDLTNATLHEAIRRVGTLPPRHPRAVSGTVPKPLAAVLAKACSPRPADRYDSASDLANDLDRWCARKPVLATRPGPWRRGARWIERHPVGATATACLTMLAATVGTSLASIAWTARQPIAVVLDQQYKHWAAIVTAAGHQVFCWRAHRDTTVMFASDVDAPKRLGGGRLAVIGMAFDDVDDRLVRLRVYKFSAPETPLWESPTAAPDIRMPPGTEDWLDDDPEMLVRFQSAVIADIYPETPEHEIAIVLNHRLKSASCLRVHSLDGDILAEAWHNGRINQIEWANDTGLLICGGVTDRPSLAELQMNGSESGYPIMVYALRPEALRRRHGSRAEPAPVLLDSWNAQPAEAFAWTRTLQPLDLGLMHEPKMLRDEGGGLVHFHIGRTPLDTLGRDLFLIFEINTRDGTSRCTPSDTFKEQNPGLDGHLLLCEPDEIETIADS